MRSLRYSNCTYGLTPQNGALIFDRGITLSLPPIGDYGKVIESCSVGMRKGAGEHQMIYLALGVALWACAHLGTTLRLGFRDALIAKLDANKYKGLFSLTMVVAIGLIVIGWQNTASLHVYDPPLWNSPLMIVLMWVALFLFVAARAPNNIKRFIRHPQLTGVMVWAGAHLLANGDNRSLILFGGLGLWALLEVILINRRDGAWVKPDAVPITRDVIVAGISGALVVVLMLLHPYFTGMPIQFGSQG